jgi:hypothetical protein
MTEPIDTSRPIATDTEETRPTAQIVPPAEWGTPPVKTGPRAGLIMLGLLVALSGIWLALGGMGLALDSELTLIALLCAGGLGLIVVAAITAARSSKRR